MKTGWLGWAGLGWVGLVVVSLGRIVSLFDASVFHIRLAVCRLGL